jgi:two-component system sensor histidine kinase/response regulator
MATPGPTSSAPAASAATPDRMGARAARYALIYATCAAAWIFLSDQAVAYLLPDPRLGAVISVAKGWAFVLVTAWLFYLTLRRMQAASGGGAQALPADLGSGEARRVAAGVIVGLVILAMGAAAITYTASRQRDAEFARLQAIAELRAERVSSWVAERRQDARTVTLDPDLVELAVRSDRGNDAAVRAALDGVLDSYRRESAYESAALVDASGRTIRSVGPYDAGNAAPLRDALARAIAQRSPTDTDLYLGADGRALYDVVAPVARAAGSGATAHAIVLRVNAARTLYPLVTNWPFESHSGETMLLRRDGATGLVLSPLRFDPDAALHRRAKYDRENGLATQAVRGPTPDSPIEGIDYRGVASIASAHRVAGTPWVLIAKLDRAEFSAASRRDALWIGLAALLALAAVGFSVQLLHEQQTLRLMRALKDRQDEALRNAELLAAISRSSHDAIFARDHDGTYLLVNEAAARFSGIPAERLLGRRTEELFPPEVAAAMRDNDRTVLATGRPIAAEHRLPTPHGDVVMLTTTGPLRGPDGTITGVYGISRDVTEIARANAELERYRNHLEELVRQRTAELEHANHEMERRAAEFAELYNDAPCGYSSVDPAGLVIAMNDTQLRWLGYRREDIVGVLRMLEIVTPASREAYRQNMLILEQRGELHEVETELVRRDGTIVPVLISATAVRDDAGRMIEARATAVDATERRARDRELARLATELQRRAAEAEAASRAKSAFLANMSHEIRTPLNAIVGLTHLVRRAGTDPAQNERLDKVVEAADHLLALINDILDISKIEAGKLTLEAAAVDVRAIVEQVRAWALERAQEKGVEIRAEVAADVPEALIGDATRLRQVLLNYASNAVKFTASGAIVLRATAAPAADGRVELRLEVEDTGIGVAEDVQARLFSAFEQGDDSTTRRHGGTGLGLAINRLIAREMDGEVGVTSRAGRGSLFWFTARLRRPLPGVLGTTDAAIATDDMPDEETLRARWLGTRVLLAEDNPINREVAEELLTEIGLSVDVATDGGQAVERAREHDYHLILMDVQMPVLDGFGATRAIRTLSWHAHTPIVAMTAAATLEDRVRARTAGMDDFIAKPFTPQSLHRMLWRWLPRDGAGATRANHADAPVAAATVVAPADSRATDPLLARLVAVPGLDAVRGLPYAGNDPRRFVRFLERFVSSARTELASCRDAVARGDGIGARRALHSMKGAASFAGAVEIRKLAQELEPQVEVLAPAALDAAVGRLANSVEQLGACIAALDANRDADEPRPAPTTAPDPAHSAAVVAKLADLLDQGDGAAVALLEQSGDLLRAALGEVTAARIARHVDAFEYEAALALLGASARRPA